MGPGRLIVVATPIGNLGDLSPRAAEALRTADVVAAEDTRRTGRLLAHIGVDTPLVSYHEHNEAARTEALLDRVEQGETVALVSDAGTPGISDPGYRLVRAAAERGAAVEAIPGPVAAVQALVLSGLPTDRFAVEGFLPRKATLRSRRLAELSGDTRTLVFYVAPHRAEADLDAMATALGPDRRAALARELTKLHEQVIRGSLEELRRVAAEGIRGEVTVVVAGASSATVSTDVEDDELAARVRELIAAGTAKKAAIADVAVAAGVPKRRVYQAVLDTS